MTDKKALNEAFAELDYDDKPVANGTERRVCEDIIMRQAFGMGKYKVSVEENPLTTRQWLQHAYEEALDLAVYLRRTMEEMDK
jgi:hypothetical protein